MIDFRTNSGKTDGDNGKYSNTNIPGKQKKISSNMLDIYWAAPNFFRRDLFNFLL